MNDLESPLHPHEPAIPPALDDEGRCLVCGLIVERDRLALDLRDTRARATRLREALELVGFGCRRLGGCVTDDLCAGCVARAALVEDGTDQEAGDTDV